MSTLTKSEERVLRVYRKFMMSPGQMLCFNGPDLKRNENALHNLMNKDMLIKERFKGGYSLTQEGYAAMKSCV
ncbi:MAG: hypothetical protein DWQ31_11770 [Planctomycetota bacterium]|nr:MAG: hypothetical protein DWQ31_11770 [Planctomycetota bacterium]REJ89826.1 MAG: hypothetical protein DWQ35_17625 [Planctomycetota bacterium]REK18019.1 MAG: hypothetical protein DWQ42_21030 [Planctomycetota bacterium]REK42318.1 MAG: hypothetical protein DWQ46_13690 [Planctomycetota bacterium]